MYKILKESKRVVSRKRIRKTDFLFSFSCNFHLDSRKFGWVCFKISFPFPPSSSCLGFLLFCLREFPDAIYMQMTFFLSGLQSFSHVELLDRSFSTHEPDLKFLFLSWLYLWFIFFFFYWILLSNGDILSVFLIQFEIWWELKCLHSVLTAVWRAFHFDSKTSLWTSIRLLRCQWDCVLMHSDRGSCVSTNDVLG